MIRLGTVVIGAEDVARAVHFWSEALDYEIVTFPEPEDGFTILRDRSGDGTRLAIHRSETAADDRPRIHLDFIVDDAREQQTEVERLLDLGAGRATWEYPTEPDFVVLSDTEGNHFCVVDTTHASRPDS